MSLWPTITLAQLQPTTYTHWYHCKYKRTNQSFTWHTTHLVYVQPTTSATIGYIDINNQSILLIKKHFVNHVLLNILQYFLLVTISLPKIWLIKNKKIVTTQTIPTIFLITNFTRSIYTTEFTFASTFSSFPSKS